MNLNWDKMDPDEVQRRKEEAKQHLEFCIKLHKIQHRARAGRYLAVWQQHWQWHIYCRLFLLPWRCAQYLFLLSHR